MNTWVIDASVAVKWILDEPLSPTVRRLVRDKVGMYAPDFLLVELDNVLWKHVRRGLLAAPDSRELRAAFRHFPVAFRPTETLIDGGFEIALAWGRSVYDSLYLALGEVLGMPVLTADRRLVNALAGTPLAGRAVWLGDMPAGSANGAGAGPPD